MVGFTSASLIQETDRVSCNISNNEDNRVMDMDDWNSNDMLDIEKSADESIEKKKAVRIAEEQIRKQAELRNEEKTNNHKLIKFVKDKFKQQPFALDPIFTFNMLTFVGDGTRFIYLWKDPKGNVRYSFNLLDSKPYSAKIANINSVLNEHFHFKFR